MLDVQNLTVEYGTRKVVEDVSFTVSEGQWLMLAGPNGAGKSTIVKAVSKGAAYKGTVLFEEKNLASYRPGALAHCLGVLSQDYHVGYSFTVEEIVRLGRYSYSKGMLAASPEEEDDMVYKALEMTGMLPLAGKSVLKLSGGELQRTFLAQLFAQNPRLLILDEPTNHLDLVYQKQIFELIQAWVKEPGRAVLSVVHDLSLARAFGTHAMLLAEGRKIAGGRTEEVFTRGHLQQVYSMDVYAWMTSMLSLWQDHK